MKSSLELFGLIASLTRSEKGYFKKFCSIYSGKKQNLYLKVFDEINKSIAARNGYDETKIMKSLNIRKQFPYIKNYLYNLILRSLRLYNSAGSPELIINELFICVQLLYEKGSIKEARKFLGRVINLSEFHEMYIYQLQAADWLLRVENSDSEIEKLMSYKKQVIKTISSVSVYQSIMNKLNHEIKKHEKDHIAEKIVETESELKIMGTEYKNCFYSEVYYRMTLSLIYFYRANWDELSINCDACLELLSRKPQCSEAVSKYYYTMMLNRILSQYYRSEFGMLNKAIIEIESETNLRGEYYYKLLLESRLILLSLHAKTGNIQKIQDELGKIITYIRKFEKKLNRGFISIFYFHIAYYFLLTGSYDGALHYINLILNNESPEVLLEIRVYTRLLNIIIHFEIDNIEHVDYKVSSIKRFLKKSARNNKFENIVIDFFRKIIMSKSKQDSDYIVERTRSDIKSLENVIGEIQVLNYFDYNSWLDSIKQKKTIKDVISG